MKAEVSSPIRHPFKASVHMNTEGCQQALVFLACWEEHGNPSFVFCLSSGLTENVAAGGGVENTPELIMHLVSWKRIG